MYTVISDLASHTTSPAPWFRMHVSFMVKLFLIYLGYVFFLTIGAQEVKLKSSDGAVKWFDSAVDSGLPLNEEQWCPRVVQIDHCR